VALGVIDNSTGIFGGNPIATSLIGPAGTGLREIYDQTRKLAASTDITDPTRSIDAS
jgi:hypothetical protein